MHENDTKKPPTLNKVLGEARRRVEVEDEELDEARTRRDKLRNLIEKEFPGSDSYVNGSVAHGDALTPLRDVDVGVVVLRVDGVGLPLAIGEDRVDHEPGQQADEIPIDGGDAAGDELDRPAAGDRAEHRGEALRGEGLEPAQEIAQQEAYQGAQREGTDRLEGHALIVYFPPSGGYSQSPALISSCMP